MFNRWRKEEINRANSVFDQTQCGEWSEGF